MTDDPPAPPRNNKCLLILLAYGGLAFTLTILFVVVMVKDELPDVVITGLLPTLGMVIQGFIGEIKAAGAYEWSSTEASKLKDQTLANSTRAVAATAEMSAAAVKTASPDGLATALKQNTEATRASTEAVSAAAAAAASNGKPSPPPASAAPPPGPPSSPPPPPREPTS